MDGEISGQLARVGAATDRLLATAAALSDAQAREPSLLPVWSRGHVLTHIARNADGLANLLRWAGTGRETPMYASAASRTADIAAGYRPADWPADFVADALPRVADSFAGRQDAPSCLVWEEGAPHEFRIGPERRAGEPLVSVHGQAATLLAWLLGRDDGAGLRVFGDDAALPTLPPWR